MRPTDTPTGELRREHELILKVVNALDRRLDAVRDSPPPVAELEDFIDFFRLFTDACHHGKEEDVLFRELQERGVTAEDGPVAVMLEEHRTGRELVRAMARALDGMRQGDEAGAWSAFERAGRDYVDLLRQHIAKEDDGVFEIADRLVTGPACARLCERYERLCRDGFEGRSLEELEQLAHRIGNRGTSA